MSYVDLHLPRWAALLLPVCASLSSLGQARSADAQECKHPPACRAEEIDAEGCCPKAAPPAPRPSAPADPHCVGGKEISADTAGHCCWAGQVWNRTRCVGVPTTCPSNLTLNAGHESCDLPACQTGQVRASDDVNCCWPGQAWSRTRSICVGIPRCPKGMEPEGQDHCVPLDKDGDGIPNAVDKCPDQPEDFNGYKDDDGCPDEPERLAMVASQQRAQAAAAAAAAAQVAAKAAAERQAAEARAAAERSELQRQQALADAQRRADKAAAAQHKRWADSRGPRAARRTAGYVLTGVGAVGAVTSGVFAGLGKGVNSSIAAGGFATGSDIASEASKGTTYNTVSEAMLVVGVVGLGVGLPLILTALPQSEPGPAPSVSLGIVPTVGGGALLGRF